MSDECIFCRMIQGDIPCRKLYENEETLAFMDIGPIIKGHVLVIPKQHMESVDEASAATLTAVLSTVQRIVRAQRSGLGAEGVNVIQNNGEVAGQAVPHLHVHVIPRFRDDGHHWNWNAGAYANDEELERFAADISGALPG